MSARLTTKPSSRPIISALRKMVRATMRGGVGEAAAVGADELHHGDADEVAEGRVDRDDREGRGEGGGAVGALHDRQAEEHRVGEERAEADGDRLAGAAVEERRAPRMPRAKQMTAPA